MNLDELRALIRTDSIVVTGHCLKRMVERDIELSEVRRAIMEGEIIEEYPEDYPYPSCLILGRGLHIVAGQGDGVLWLITVYRPDLRQWESDLKTRRKTT